MILTRAPLRIALVGGGTDYPPFVKEHGGFCVTAAIGYYVYIAINGPWFAEGYRLRYSETEYVTDKAEIGNIKHPIIREALKFYDVPPNVEISSMADVPSGTGLGSSAAFTVALCYALATHMRLDRSQYELAQDAAIIELDLAIRGGGAQDHYASALGDLQILEFAQSGQVFTGPLHISDVNYCALQDRLSLYYMGQSRNADAILRTQSTEGLSEIKAYGEDGATLLEQGDLDGFADLLNDHWQAKRRRSPHMSSPEIDALYDFALANGADGGKLVGAGGAGFLLCYSREKDRLAKAMHARGLTELPMRFDALGTTLLCNA